jgi:Nif-specific regulatory protein
MTDLRSDELQRVTRERDLYRALLQLGVHEDLPSLLQRALELLVEITGAERGYLELRGDDSDGADRGWSIGHACSPEEIADIRRIVSRGIVAEALSTGRTIRTQSALLDERFNTRESVRAHKIEAVLCAPIAGQLARGVVYLQGRRGEFSFSDEDQRWAEQLAGQLAPLAERLAARAQAESASDATRELRRRFRLEGIVGQSAAFAEALREAMLAAPLDVNVLLLGASGTGKSQLARAIHENSPRSPGPFVELNCAALPEPLLESELFGARAGAHSEARRDALGKVAAAERGTLFLDEIGELPVGSQAKLLQLLQTKQYFPLGSATPLRADLRVIAATNQDLQAAVRERRFREDLYYRLQVLPIRMPSLAERTGDLALLARHISELVCRRNNLPSLSLGHTALAGLRAAEWPGNVRQLEHALEAAAIRAAGEGADQIGLRHVFPEAPAAREGVAPSFQAATRAFQRELLEKTLAETGWNVAETARRLELARSHVYNLIGAFGFDRRAER